ncbi:hypothetical protein KPNJ1_00462 [Klebsiella pneumoniae 30660/NJST258_1]|nr:hypothetical protein KPNJ1_00462 [Klebsiella pneumoniae 30660/NJST258_1]
MSDSGKLSGLLICQAKKKRPQGAPLKPGRVIQRAG